MRYFRKKQKYKSERGFWEYSRFQKRESDINEQFLKSRCPSGNFDHNKIEKMMYPKKSKEDIILEKYNNNEKLRSDEKVISNNIITKPIEASFINGIALDKERAWSIDVSASILVRVSMISGRSTIKAAPIKDPLIDPNPPIIIIARKKIDN